MSLTDLWKEGKLKTGWYYVMFNCYDTPKPSYYSNKYNVFSNDGKTEEVLAPVTSYEELQELKHFDGKNVCVDNEVLETKIAELIETNDSLNRQIKHLLNLQTNQDKEVESLRDLLKECKPFVQKDMESIRAVGWDKTGYFNKLYNLLAHINTAIGESEE